MKISNRHEGLSGFVDVRDLDYAWYKIWKSLRADLRVLREQFHATVLTLGEGGTYTL
uniref:Uncharacterized protein n=1 Tax=Peronospora matthiolae TaxID=2874970 RepID=A0AAV1T036_9STRA